MAIRERFRRAMRKSDGSDSMSPSDSTAASSTRPSSGSDSSPPSPKKSYTLSRTFAFGRRDKDKDRGKEKAKQKEKERKKLGNNKLVHPSEKPLTAQNLEHQAMFSQFTMTFGTTNLSQIEDLDYGGVSPCCTRPCSIDGGSS